MQIRKYQMFDEVSHTLSKLREKLHQERYWLKSFKTFSNNIDFLDNPWVEKNFIHDIPTEVPSITKISGVDGGLISEALAGLDLIIYRAVGVTFNNIGKKAPLEAVYTPNFAPEPSTYIGPSLPSRQEFLKLATLYRLLVEYEVALETIKSQDPTVLFLDGRVVPLASDFREINNQVKTITQIEIAVKEMYRDLIRVATEKNVLICGIIKDSRSHSLTKALSNSIPDWIRSKAITSDTVKGWRDNLSNMLDHNLCAGILVESQRTAWLRQLAPEWISSKSSFSIWSSLVRPIKEDVPIKIEILMEDGSKGEGLDIALGALSVLSKHGLPIAIPTIIQEADNRVRLSSDHLDHIINEISLAIGISRDELRKRRKFRSTLDSY